MFGLLVERSLVKDFIRLKLADEIRLSILPIILGDGTAFF